MRGAIRKMYTEGATDEALQPIIHLAKAMEESSDDEDDDDDEYMSSEE